MICVVVNSSKVQVIFISITAIVNMTISFCCYVNY